MVLGFFGEPYGQKNCQMCDYCLNPTGANGTSGPQAGSSGQVDMSDDAALLMNAVKFCGVSRDNAASQIHKAVLWRMACFMGSFPLKALNGPIVVVEMFGANGALVCVQRGVQHCAAGRFGLGVAVNVLCANDKKKPFNYHSSGLHGAGKHRSERWWMSFGYVW
jgi:hypothetical protein